MKRRHFLAGAAALGVGGTLLVRPEALARPHTLYFKVLNKLLHLQNPTAVPTLLVDTGRLKANAAQITASLNQANLPLRLVVKSLPSIQLLRLLMYLTNTNRLMVFHQPFINAIAKALPQSDLLLGKPMPVQAAQEFYAQLERDVQSGSKAGSEGAASFEPRLQLQWLIDSKERLLEYLQLAKTLGTSMRINIEIDVGLHRGGLRKPSELDALIAIIKDNPDYLSFSGFMGYGAHIGSIPRFIESEQSTFASVCRTYHSFIERLHQLLPESATQALCFNGAGSSTVLLHAQSKIQDSNPKTRSPLNEVSAGSCFVKPSNFDLPALSKLKPAVFIATPVLKSWDGLLLPGSSAVSGAWSAFNPNRRHTFFIYGGNWKADPVSPSGLSKNGLFGSSSNQEMYNASSSAELQVGDYVFFRPTQSESVMLEFTNSFFVGGVAGDAAGDTQSMPMLMPMHHFGSH